MGETPKRRRGVKSKGARKNHNFLAVGIGASASSRHALEKFFQHMPDEKINLEVGSGLISMRERAVLVGGTLEIESIPDKGTTIFARIPIQLPNRKERQQ